MAATETELHDMIRESVGAIADDYDREYWREHVENKRFPTDYWEDLAADGWLGVAVPEEYGGEGLGMLEMSIVIEELSRGGGGGGILFVLTPVFGGIGITRHGTEAQKAEYLPRIVDGDVRFCMALTEAAAGTNTLNIDTQAERDGEEFVVNGQKTFISGVNSADAMLLVARTDSGITLFVVDEPNARSAITARPIETHVPWFERQFEVAFDGLRVHEDDILGTEGGGFALLWDTLNTERIAGAASSIGGGLRAIDLAVDYANDRQVFGDTPIGAYQGIQHPLADAYAKLIAARAVMYEAARKWDAGEEAGMEANVAKLRASVAGLEAADQAIQTHGGNGFTPEYEVHAIWQNMRLSKTAPISNEMVKNFIANHTLGLPQSY